MLSHPFLVLAALHVQVCIAHAFAQRGRSEEALTMFRDTFESAARALGPDTTYVANTLVPYYDLLKDLGKKTQIKKLLQRAACLGVDTSACNHELYTGWREVARNGLCVPRGMESAEFVERFG